MKRSHRNYKQETKNQVAEFSKGNGKVAMETKPISLVFSRKSAKYDLINAI